MPNHANFILSFGAIVKKVLGCDTYERCEQIRTGNIVFKSRRYYSFLFLPLSSECEIISLGYFYHGEFVVGVVSV